MQSEFIGNWDAAIAASMFPSGTDSAGNGTRTLFNAWASRLSPTPIPAATVWLVMFCTTLPAGKAQYLLVISLILAQ